MNISDVIALWQFNILPDSPLNKHNPTFSIVFYSAAAATGFCHDRTNFCLSPKFLNKGCEGYQKGVAAFAFNADVFVCDGCQSSNAPVAFY